MELVKRIKERREALNLSQEELSKMLGYKSRSTINKIELGINDVTQHKIVAFAKALQTTPAYLMGWEEEPSYKKEDAVTDIFKRLKDDDKFFQIVEKLSGLNDNQLTAIDTIISTLQQN